MFIDIPAGSPWGAANAEAKLALRAKLPGAQVFDLAALALANARAAGLSEADQLTLAMPASWLVNSPATSRVLQRWATAPACGHWLRLVALLRRDREELSKPDARSAMIEHLRPLGEEPWLAEAVSKVPAPAVPEGVPLMPPAARAFVLGGQQPASAEAFADMVAWFAVATATHHAALTRIGERYGGPPLSGPQALDRLLWFDSEGHSHFPNAI